MVRDADGVPGKNIRILKQLPIAGGSVLSGAAVFHTLRSGTIGPGRSRPSALISMSAPP
jgi:myosin-crossreactive antigen